MTVEKNAEGFLQVDKSSFKAVSGNICFFLYFKKEILFLKKKPHNLSFCFIFLSFPTEKCKIRRDEKGNKKKLVPELRKPVFSTELC